jgi:hypothetical protein
MTSLEDCAMPSPFPGMDPYLEQDDVWHDFHERLVPLIAERIGAQIRPDYFVKIDEHVYIHELPGDERRFLGRGDVTVGPTSKSGGKAATTGILQPPWEFQFPAVDVESHSYLKIRDRRNRQLITVIELLSPANKQCGPDRDLYLGERWNSLAKVSFVEINLLRGGERMPFVDLPENHYYVMIKRAERWPRGGIWPINLREQLPIIGIPLRAPDADAKLDLQEVLNHVHDAAGYRDYIYEGAPNPPLSSEDAAWARTCLGDVVKD